MLKAGTGAFVITWKYINTVIGRNQLSAAKYFVNRVDRSMRTALMLGQTARSILVVIFASTGVAACGGNGSDTETEAFNEGSVVTTADASDEIQAVPSDETRDLPVETLDEPGAVAGRIPNDSGGSGIELEDPRGDNTDDSEVVLNTVFVPEVSDIDDNRAVYEQDGYAEVDVIRIDVKTSTVAGICEPGNQSGCTLDDVLADINASDNFKVDIPVHFAATDFSDDGLVSNAELRQRGGGTRNAPQKSFRLKLDDKDVLWRGERHLQLNKHPFENSRIRNKLAFDLMSGIAHLPSFRTQFVNLWIDDGDGPVDQGLYTHVERGDERYLKRHDLDDDAQLYKASSFEFREKNRRELSIDDEGKPVNEDVFDSVLEIENGKDHRNLIAMLDALHDPEQSFDSVMERYFNENNVLTWVAVNLLLGQQDATRHNYFLYNPEDTEKFYFLPWDYDSAFLEHKLPTNELTAESLKSRLKYGYAVGANNDFLELYYRRPGAHERILAAAEELRESYLDNATIAARAQQLSAVSGPFASAMPDIAFNEYYSNDSSADLAEKVAFNQEAMINHFGIPLPPTLYEPVLDNGQWSFTWHRAHEMTGSTLTYRLQLSTSVTFQPDDIVAQFEGIEDSSSQVIEHVVDATRLRSGVHYARLFAISDDIPEVNWQVADNELELQGDVFYGVVSFSTGQGGGVDLTSTDTVY